jgi:hypothetical protein
MKNFNCTFIELDKPEIELTENCPNYCYVFEDPNNIKTGNSLIIIFFGWSFPDCSYADLLITLLNHHSINFKVGLRVINDEHDVISQFFFKFIGPPKQAPYFYCLKEGEVVSYFNGIGNPKELSEKIINVFS